MPGFPAASLDRILRGSHDNGIVLLLGATDTGKSTLARQLWAKTRGEVVDGDLGQAWIGPPTLLSRGAPGKGDRPAKLSDAMFIGSTHPAHHALEVVHGTSLLAHRARRPCVVDADGFVSGSLARAMKSALLATLRPDVLVLLERDRELGWYAQEAKMRDVKVVRVHATHSEAKSLAVRAQRRREGFMRALSRGAKVTVDPSRVSFERTLWNRGERIETKSYAKAIDCEVLAGWRTGDEALVVCNGFPHLVEEAREEFGLRELHAVHANHFNDLLVGLERADGDGGTFVALGVTRGVDWRTGRINVWTKTERGSFDALRPGSIRLGERFHELEHVRIP